MQIREETQQNVLILAPVGHLDTRSQHEFEAKVLERLNSGDRHFLIDMSEIEYISSAGLRVMLMLAKKLGGTEGQLVLAGMNQHVHQVFEISGLTGVFTIRKTRDEALGSFSSVDPTIARVANLASRLMDVSRAEGSSAGGAAPSPVSAQDAAAVAEIAVNLLRLRSDTAPPPPRATNGASVRPTAPVPAPQAAAPAAPAVAAPAAPAPAAVEPAPAPVDTAREAQVESATATSDTAGQEMRLVDRLVAFFRSMLRR